MIKRDQLIEDKSSRKCFLKVSTQRCVPKEAKIVPHSGSWIWWSKNHSGGAGSEDTKGEWNTSGLALSGKAGVPEESLGRGYWWKCSPAVEWDPCILAMPVPWDDFQKQQYQWNGASLSFGDNLCWLQWVEPEKWPRSFRGAQIMSGSQTLYNELFTSWHWFCIFQIVTVPWLLPIKERKYLTYFVLYWRPQLKDFELLKRVWILKVFFIYFCFF